MMNLANEATRELPVPPYAFGLIAFGIFAFLLYITLRLDK
ncbi:unannotated protein [freshwater metagenome]|jgi:hypothetical protein|uniref:Unannotated protein n=1 Tax=freshwater metagenome TaxID=449393 RepID=A0A6J6BGG3_9ZZZZ